MLVVKTNQAESSEAGPDPLARFAPPLAFSYP
jgi:hypothetical protein